METSAGGCCTKVRRHFARPKKPRPGTRRGAVREFSRKSRTRLQQTLCALPVDHVSRGVLFVTLTYPKAYPGSWSTWKRHLDSWLKRMRRRLPRSAAVWKLEPQRRGAPHFHLLVVGAPFMAKEWLSRSWFEVVGSRDAKHLAAGTNISLARSHRGVLSYAAKYTAKAQSLPADWQDGVGRWWGVCNRDGLGISWTWATLSQPEFWRVVRVLRALVRKRRPRRARGPPRSFAAGMWLPLTDNHSARLLRWLDTLARPAISGTYARAATSHPTGRSAAEDAARGVDPWPWRVSPTIAAGRAPQTVQEGVQSVHPA